MNKNPETTQTQQKKQETPPSDSSMQEKKLRALRRLVFRWSESARRGKTSPKQVSLGKTIVQTWGIAMSPLVSWVPPRDMAPHLNKFLGCLGGLYNDLVAENIKKKQLKEALKVLPEEIRSLTVLFIPSRFLNTFSAGSAPQPPKQEVKTPPKKQPPPRQPKSQSYYSPEEKKRLLTLQRLMLSWIESAKLGALSPRQVKLCKNLKNQGLIKEQLCSWIPPKSMVEHLQKSMGYLSSTNSVEMSPEIRKKLINKFFLDIPAAIQQQITSLIPAKIVTIAAATTTTTTNTSTPKSTTTPKSGTSSTTAPPRERARSQKPALPKRPAEPLPASRTGNLQKWNNISSTVTLYIDEKWDIDQKLSGDRNLWGTIAAVAWADNAPRPRELPKISLPARGHVRSLGGMGTHMKDLFACSSAFPILLPIFTKNALQPDTYKKVLGLSLQLILGWILPKPSSPRTCNIFLEHYSGFERGTEKTEYFEGLFEGLQLLNPARFSCWKLGRVEWRSKDHGYIPYADILAYCMGKSEIARSLREKFDVEKMKGYVPFHQDLIPMLLRLENIETAHNVADILDLSRDLHGTALLHTLLQDLKRRLIHKTEIHRKLYEELDARYLKKERDLRELRLQLHTINVLTGELPKDAPLSLRMMEIAVKLQSANHEGDPYRYRETVDQYTSLLNRARENGLHELAAHCELNRAVRLSDQFRTAEALALVEKMKKMGYLSLGTLGKVWSSCGQYLSMMGDYRQAEGAFGKALELFKNAEYTTEEERKAEHDQTSVYRAINALDGGFTSAHEYLENVLRDLPTAAKNLAVAGPQKNPFHHHLFLRAIWWSKNLCAEARLEYLNRYQRWQTGEQHPWELIEMYRGLLLKGTRKTEGAECFERAISVALLDSHGPTLRLSAAMIAVAGYCCYKRESFKNRALALLGETEPLIPHAAPMIQALRHLCRNPGEDKISQVLKLFPFNFH